MRTFLAALTALMLFAAAPVVAGAAIARRELSA
jgi:hypothetical protein